MPDTTPTYHPALDLWQQFALGRLSADETQRLEQHLENCPACCEKLEQCEGAIDPLARLLNLSGGSTPLPVIDRDGFATLQGISDSATPAQAPSLLGRYEILDELGRGGMGVVYKARDLQLRRFVAIKMIRNGSFDDADSLARFHAEGLAVARLRHPHIVQLLEVGEEQGTPYQVLEFLDGGSLSAHCDHQPQDFTYAARLVQTLAEAVEHAHGQGVIHRDLKPANVLLTADGVAKVTDFGLAKFDRQRLAESLPVVESAPGLIVGTPHYMSPEQARGVPGTIGTSTDIYALGVIFYELLTGDPPTAGLGNPLEILQALQVQEPAPPRSKRLGLPRDLEVICLKCLRIEPQHRYVTAGELAAELGRFLRGEPILARPLSWKEQAGRWCRRNPLSAGLLGGLAAVIIASLIGLTLLYLDADTQREQADQERKEAQKQKAEAQQQKKEADIQRDGALEYFDVARRAVTTFQTRVMTDPKLKQNDFRSLRANLLASTVQFYEALVRRRTNDLRLQLEQARAFRQLGDLRKELGENDAALKAYGQGISLLHSLIEKTPSNRTCRVEIAWTSRNQAMLLGKLGRFEEAFAAFRAALPIQEQLVKEDQKDTSPQANLLALRGNYANLLAATGRPAEAAQHLRDNLPLMEALVSGTPTPENRSSQAALNANISFHLSAARQLGTALPFATRARQQFAKLAEEFPSEPRFRQEWGAACVQLGSVLSALDKTEDALAAFQEAQRVYDGLVQAHPSVPEYRVALGGAICNVGLMFTRLEKTTEALPCFGAAILELERVHRMDPRHVTARAYLGESFVGRASVLEQLNRYEEAIRDWNQAITLAEVADKAARTLGRARAMVQMGRVTEGIAVLEEALTAEGSPDLRMGAASVWSLAANKSAQDSVAAEHYLMNVIKLLESLASEGHLRRPDLANQLRTRPEFAAVRSHPAYQRLLSLMNSAP